MADIIIHLILFFENFGKPIISLIADDINRNFENDTQTKQNICQNKCCAGRMSNIDSKTIFIDPFDKSIVSDDLNTYLSAPKVSSVRSPIIKDKKRLRRVFFFCGRQIKCQIILMAAGLLIVSEF